MSDPERPAADGDRVVDGADATLPVSVRIHGFGGLRPTPRRLELRRLAAATRRLIEHLVSTTATTRELADSADTLEDLAARFEALPKGSTYSGFAEAANAGQRLREHLEEVAAGTAVAADGSPGDSDDDPSEFFAMFDHSPFIGLANPLSPPVELRQSGDRVLGRVTFGSAYEGPPGCVHGGYVAAVFDELLGATQSMSGTQGMTAHLGIDYRRPTPLHRPLRLEGWLHEHSGRKIWAKGELRLDEESDGTEQPVLAEATALFIAFDPGRFRELLEARDGTAPDE
jgi:acyl-coenzyme A thioesterase PaaI-like protein